MLTILPILRKSSEFVFKVVFASGFAFCSFVIGCDNPTYNLSSISLFIILVELFFTNKGLRIGFILSLVVRTFGSGLPQYQKKCFCHILFPLT